MELGVDEVNAMKKFKKLFSLDFAIITSIGEMHLSTFKTLDNIIKEKMSVSSLLKEDGILENLGGGCVKPAKEGTTTVDIWHYDAANDTNGEFIGTITVNVVAGEYDY